MNDDDQPPTPAPDDRPWGERPGMNQNPLSPSFRDGPTSRPASVGAILMGGVPVVVLVVILLLVNR